MDANVMDLWFVNAALCHLLLHGRLLLCDLNACSLIVLAPLAGAVLTFYLRWSRLIEVFSVWAVMMLSA